jgi:hypothetical protein
VIPKEGVLRAVFDKFVPSLSFRNESCSERATQPGSKRITPTFFKGRLEIFISRILFFDAENANTPSDEQGLISKNCDKDVKTEDAAREF